MYEIIAPTLFQNKICRLPGIGTLVMVTQPAKTDFGKSRITSPTETIDFLAGDDNEKGFNEFSAISELLQKNLDENGSFLLNGIGNFIKDDTAAIRFEPIAIDPVFTPFVTAERITRQEKATHAILLGDQQTSNLEMTGLFNEKPAAADRWCVWAIILAAVGVSILLFYFYQHGFNALGNVNYQAAFTVYSH